ncbi:F0F1 ATP synthase subunit B [Crocosphaera sp. UHCC 0190]|uniref:F0F1 ATP synthase subunit B family protein n=1 Tax=Crocosphaera sp. UHCC 0190 TaxID=3110246 RepID=UPI002B211838|nr:F0F1 ATP synthase subunit B [Crocosphaera sp. UHCC 0190]MEA5510144.1 F0F1 ATP synthase subunit B [Crocosphaera sp. UHCC 0190]
MLIDPFTTVAQIINFIILLFLLKRFLYRPILQAMKQREQRIFDSLKEAETKSEIAQKEAEKYRKKQQEWEFNKQNRFDMLKQEIEAEKQSIMARKQEEIESLRAQWYEQLKQEKQTFLEELSQQVNQQVIKIARQALENLANVSLEEQIIAKFIEGLPDLTEQQRQAHPLGKTENQTFTIRSNFPINLEQQEQLIKALQKQFEQDIDVKFNTTSDSICGIELLNHGYRISWHLDHYLDELEAKMSQSLVGQENAPKS